MTRDPGLAGWLQLSLTPGIGAAAVRTMLRQFGLPHSILQRKRSELAPYVGPVLVATLCAMVG
jgi:DNA processing protein